MIAIPTAAYFAFPAGELSGQLPAATSQADRSEPVAGNAGGNRDLPPDETEPVGRPCQDDQFLWHVLGSWDL